MQLKRYHIILIAIFTVAALGFIGSVDAEDAQFQEEQYCAMVKLWKETRGQSGWPAYDGERMCK
jgi:hypothetical protein